MVDVVSLLQVVSDSTRFRLMEIIGKGEICACELPPKVGVTQPAVSQHLQVLKKSGLVLVRRDGTMRLYSLSVKAKKILSDIREWQK